MALVKAVTFSHLHARSVALSLKAGGPTESRRLLPKPLSWRFLAVSRECTNPKTKSVLIYSFSQRMAEGPQRCV